MSRYSVVPLWATYICTEPAGDVPLLIHNGPDEYTAQLRTLQRSADHFSEKDQTRVVERIQFEQARLHIQHEQWKHAMRILVPLWQTLSWRKSGWWHLLEEVDRELQECARQVEDAEALVAVRWELLNQSLTTKQGVQSNFADIFETLPTPKTRLRTKLRAENILSCVSLGFAFITIEGHVGMPLTSQLAISSHLQNSSEIVHIKKVRVAFEGGLKDIHIEHDSAKKLKIAGKAEQTRLHNVKLGQRISGNDTMPTSPTSPSSGNLSFGLADMKLAAGSTFILAFTDVPRNAEEVEVSSITLIIQEKDFDLELLFTEDEQMQQDHIFFENAGRVSSRQSRQKRSNAIRILPKPPKLRLDTSGAGKENYIDERFTIDVDVTNEEEDEANVALDVRLLGPSHNVPAMTWVSDEDKGSPLEKTDFSMKNGMQRTLEILPPSSKQQHQLLLEAPPHPADYVLEVMARYYLKSDPETPILKSTTTELVFRPPIEAVSSYSPSIHPKPWPNYFEIGVEHEHVALGLVQRWSLISRFTILATLPLDIERVEPRVIQVQEAAHCTITAVDVDPTKSYTLPPGDLLERRFVIDAQKLNVDDRRTTFFDLDLEVTWRRKGSIGSATITRLPLPDLAVPFGEPRVLACARDGANPSGVIRLDYMIENPSIYTLTFSLTMDTSEEFAFSGVKTISLQLVPLSRHCTGYNILPLVKGAWISPQLKVYDTQFHKNLKIHGTGGLRNDRKGISIWVDADG